MPASTPRPSDLADFALASSRPNVCIYLLDDWPFEFWPTVKRGTDGLPNDYDKLLPHLSRTFVNEGLAIKHMYTHIKSAPSRRSFLSGRYMTSTGTSNRYFSDSLSTKISTLGERLKSAGCNLDLGRANAQRLCSLLVDAAAALLT